MIKKYYSREFTELEKKLYDIIKTSKFHPKSETVLLNLEVSAHLLSKEEQMYFTTITEGVFGCNEQVRSRRLKQLATDYHVGLILPYLCVFIKETIRCNLVLSDLTLLIYTLRMTKSLLANEHINLKPYIHEILPAILSCALARKISRYYSDNHWTLRDFSAFVIFNIVQAYSDKYNNMQERVMKIYLKGIIDMDKGLATTYGAVKGLSSLGEEAVQKYLLPHLMIISSKIQKILDVSTFGIFPEFQKEQMNEAKHVRNLVVSTCAPILYKTRNINDGGLSYVKDFGYLGKPMYIQVKNMESLDQARLQQAQYLQQMSGYYHSNVQPQNSIVVAPKVTVNNVNAINLSTKNHSITNNIQESNCSAINLTVGDNKSNNFQLGQSLGRFTPQVYGPWFHMGLNNYNNNYS